MKYNILKILDKPGVHGIISAKGRVKWAKEQVPSLLEQLFLWPFDERERKRMLRILGKSTVFRVSARDLLQSWYNVLNISFLIRASARVRKTLFQANTDKKASTRRSTYVSGWTERKWLVRTFVKGVWKWPLSFGPNRIHSVGSNGDSHRYQGKRYRKITAIPSLFWL